MCGAGDPVKAGDDVALVDAVSVMLLEQGIHVGSSRGRIHGRLPYVHWYCWGPCKSDHGAASIVMQAVQRALFTELPR